jgi:hypothetical protein
MAVLGKVMLLLLPLLKWVVLMYDCMFGWIYTLRFKPAERKKGYSKVTSTVPYIKCIRYLQDTLRCRILNASIYIVYAVSLKIT